MKIAIVVLISLTLSSVAWGEDVPKKLKCYHLESGKMLAIFTNEDEAIDKYCEERPMGILKEDGEVRLIGKKSKEKNMKKSRPTLYVYDEAPETDYDLSNPVIEKVKSKLKLPEKLQQKCYHDVHRICEEPGLIDVISKINKILDYLEQKEGNHD